jgi:hypothetical protein
MTRCTRRSFLVHASIGVAGGALVGGFTALPARAGSPVARPATRGATGAAPPDGLIVHVRDVATGDISVMVGTREVLHRDRALAQHLLDIAAGAR